MSHRLFDIQSGFGGAARASDHVVAAAECLEEMEHLGIGGALVRTAPDDVEVDVAMANQALFAACGDDERLVPCPILVPATAGDVPAEAEQVAAAIARGSRAGTIRPARDSWEILPWVSDRLFSAMADRRLPVVCLLRYVPLREVAVIAERFPSLPVVLAEVPYGCQRLLYPLLERHTELRLSLGENWTVHLGIEDLVARFGAQRLLFGTGFPRVEPAMAVTQLAYAEIPELAKAAIGHENAGGLLGAVELQR
jgi:hypothetical protein